MVKKPPKKTKTSNGAKLGKIKSWFIRSPWWAKLFLALLALVLVSLTSTAYQQWQLEKRFGALDEDVSALLDSDEIIYEKEKYCFHESVKYGGGALKCKIEIKINPIDNQSIDAIFENAQLNKTWRIAEPPISTNSTTEIENIDTNIVCRISTAENNLDFYCSEKSKRAFYPYRD